LNHRVLFLLVLLGLSVATASAQSNVPRFNFEVGGGLGIGKGLVGRVVGGSYQGEAGAGLNFSRTFGFNGEYLYYGLPIKESVIKQQFGWGNSAGGSVQAASLNGIVTPLHGHLGVYGIFGVGFYVRNVSTTRNLLLKGAACQPAWKWWDLTCTLGPNPALTSDQTISSNTKDAGGFNFGGGVTFGLHHLHHARLFVEGRYHRAYHSDVQTTFIPATVGLRW
jgi:hypothetical protein